jgi:hypothetical protein
MKTTNFFMAIPSRNPQRFLDSRREFLTIQLWANLTKIPSLSSGKTTSTNGVDVHLKPEGQLDDVQVPDEDAEADEEQAEGDESDDVRWFNSFLDSFDGPSRTSKL